MDKELIIRGRVIGEEELKLIRGVIKSYWSRGRKVISQELCRTWDWRQYNGLLKEQVCRILLVRLERMGLIELPPQKHPDNNAKRSYYRPPKIPPSFSQDPLEGRLKDFPPIELKMVRASSWEPLWNWLVYHYHYQSYRLNVGAHLKYLAFLDSQPVACLAWGSTVPSLKCRDDFIGWSPKTKRKNLHLILNHTRYLILPWVEIKFLASHLLSKNIQRIAKDWLAFYGHPIYLLESFVDRNRFSGTCYRAANWLYVGQTKGYCKKREGFIFHGNLKDVYLYPLVKDFRRYLLD